MTARFKDLCLDTNNHQAMADWWCTVLGYVRESGDRNPEWPVPIVDPTGAGPLIWIIPVPEAKAVKNRMHLDVHGDVDWLLTQGASMVRRRDNDIEWDVLADPEGNEFCVFAEKD